MNSFVYSPEIPPITPPLIRKQYFNETFTFTKEQLTEIQKLLLQIITVYGHTHSHDYIWNNVENELKYNKCCHYNKERTKCEIHLNYGCYRAMHDLYKEGFILHYNVSNFKFTIIIR
jgi:hypothetical protein